MSDPHQPQVDWTQVKPGAGDRIGGGDRVYRGVDAKGPIAWACPACGNQNQSPLQEGCPSCGSGKPGTHVGVDPIVTPEMRAQMRKKGYTGQQTDLPRTTDVQASYLEWKRLKQLPPMTPATDQWLFDAFRAGWDAHQLQLGQGTILNLDLPPTTAPAVPPAAPPPTAHVEEDPAPPTAGSFPGTAKERTLLAALRFFRSSVVPEAAEEMATGEWMGIGAIDQWIAELTEKLSDYTNDDSNTDGNRVINDIAF